MPAFTTSFVGRDAEQDQLRSHLRAHALIALVGPAGVGKTRLAVAVLDEMSPEVFRRIIHVPVHHVATAEQMTAVLATRLGLGDSPSIRRDEVWDELARCATAVLVDGCELLQPEAWRVLGDGAQRGTHIRVVATSRRLLSDRLEGVGVATVNVRPLPVPLVASTNPDGDLPGAACGDPERRAAVTLFADRARTVVADFTLSASNCELVAEICRRLDGVPLAIELVAPWTRALSLQQILERIEGPGDFPPTQATAHSPRPSDGQRRTLRSLVDSTWQLCSPDERQLWQQLSVFPAGFDLQALEAVCKPTSGALLDVLASLIDQSIIAVETAGDHARYRLLNLTRDYAVVKATDNDALRRAHFDYFHDLVVTEGRHEAASSQPRRLQALSQEMTNIVAAIERGMHEVDTIDATLRMASDLWTLWFATGRITTGRSVLRRLSRAAARQVGVDRIALADMQFVHAYLCVLQGSFHEADDVISGIDADGGADDISPGTRRTIEGMRRHVRAMVHLGRGDLAVATADIESALAAYRSSDEQRSCALTLDALCLAALVAVLSGDVTRAGDLARTGQRATRECGDVVWNAYFELTLGIEAWRQGGHTEARSRVAIAMRTTPDAVVIAHGVELLAWCAADERRYSTAATLFAAAEHRWSALADRFVSFAPIADLRERCLTATRANLTLHEFDDATRAGHDLSIEEILTASDRPVTVETMRPDQTMLTPRELQVARLIAAGCTNRQIADDLTIAQRTAESHVDHILTKMNFSSRAQVAAWVAGGEHDHAGRTSRAENPSGHR